MSYEFALLMFIIAITGLQSFYLWREADATRERVVNNMNLFLKVLRATYPHADIEVYRVTYKAPEFSFRVQVEDYVIAGHSWVHTRRSFLHAKSVDWFTVDSPRLHQVGAMKTLKVHKNFTQTGRTLKLIDEQFWSRRDYDRQYMQKVIQQVFRVADRIESQTMKKQKRLSFANYLTKSHIQAL